MMFWVGLLVAFVAAMIGIGLVREWIKRLIPEIRDLVLDRIIVFLIVLGVILSAAGYNEQTATIVDLVDEQAGRVLSADQKANLMEDLGRLPKSSVYMMGIQGDREAIRFANILKDVFLSVGWTVDGVWDNPMIIGPGPGIQVRHNSSSTDSVGQNVTEALKKIHLQARLVQYQDISTNELQVIVGSRP